MGRNAQLTFGIAVQSEFQCNVREKIFWGGFFSRGIRGGFSKGNVLVKCTKVVWRDIFREGDFRGRNVGRSYPGWDPHAGSPVSTCNDYDFCQPD